VEPSRREPETKSASPARIGATRPGISAGSYWPSASRLTSTWAPRSAASRYPKRRTAPWPWFTGMTHTNAPRAAATALVPSSSPSTTTRVVTAWPSTSLGTSESTGPMLSTSL
jgi:hypothetical protein